MKSFVQRMFQCFNQKKHTRLTESCSMIKKVGDETESFKCEDCGVSYKQSIGFYETDSGMAMCLKCHDGSEPFRLAVAKSHSCPFAAKEPCELVFQYHSDKDSGTYVCGLCSRGPFSARTGRFCCLRHAFSVCWDCIHPPFSFIVCPSHPYLRLDNSNEAEEGEYKDGTYRCQVCGTSGHVKDGRYRCPIKHCGYDICSKCFAVPMYFDEATKGEAKEEESKPQDKSVTEDKPVEFNMEGFEEVKEPNKGKANLDNSISNADFGIEFNIDKREIRTSAAFEVHESDSKREISVNDQSIEKLDT